MGVLLAVVEALLEVALTIPYEPPPIATATATAAMDLVSLRDNIC